MKIWSMEYDAMNKIRERSGWQKKRSDASEILLICKKTKTRAVSRAIIV